MNKSETWEDLKKWAEEYRSQIGDCDDYHKRYVEQRLETIFPEYPDIELKNASLKFAIGQNTKNAVLVFAIVNSFPEGMYSVNKSDVIIQILDEFSLYKCMQRLLDLVCVVGKWKSFQIFINGDLINTSDFWNYCEYIVGKNEYKLNYYRRDIKSIKTDYLKGKRKTKNKERIQQISRITRNNLAESLRAVVNKYIELYGNNKEVEIFTISEHHTVVGIENDLIVSFRLLPVTWRRMDDDSIRPWANPHLIIQELTHNNLFKFNFTNFYSHFSSDHIGIEFLKYHGLHYYRKEIDNFDIVDEAIPELELSKRFEEYQGEINHIILLKMQAENGEIQYGVGITKGAIHSFILKLCKELEEKNSRMLELNGASCLLYNPNKDFISAFLSWKGEKKRWRLENKFSYYYEDQAVKNDLELTYTIPYDVIKDAKDGKYDECEFGSYHKPLNRWKSEELVYKITKKLFNEYQVIYQYRPYYLSTDKGNMSYDVYICGIKIAIEYQGKQHFEPVDYFGGKDNFVKQQERDRLKKQLSKENGVKLIYINYWDDITPALIKCRIEDAINKEEQ